MPAITKRVTQLSDGRELICFDDIRLMLQVTSPRRAAGKPKYLAGSETGMGAFTGDIPPEDAAARRREVLNGLS
jgi:galactose-1-phosphate uridylyltransferase